MTLFLETTDAFTAWAGETIAGVRYPHSIETTWAADDLEKIGLYRPVPADPVPEGKVVLSQSVRRVDGVVRWVQVLGDAPEPDPTQVIEGFRSAIQDHVDTQARSRRYDSGNSLATYVASTVVQWAAEAVAFVCWRDAVWAYAYAEMDKVLGAEREQPTVQEFLDELPEIVWPS